jgi:hypothetical protein
MLTVNDAGFASGGGNLRGRKLIGGALAAAAALFLSATAAQAITVETTNFIASPTNFNGFEGIGAHVDYVGATPYVEDGISVEYVGAPGLIWTQALYQGNYGWYPINGSTGYTRISLTSLGDFGSIQFLAGSGFGGYELQYELLNDGAQVATGTAGPLSNSLMYYGFSGGGFDEVRLQNRGGTNVPFLATSYEAGAFDSIAVDTRPAGVPEPAGWALLLMGFGLAGGALRARRGVAQLR